MRKVLSLLMVALLSTAFLFAGGSNESSDGPVVINHWYWVPNADVARYTEMIDEFNRTHTDVQVNWENVPQDDVRTRFITAFQIGEGPDTFGMGGNWIPEFQAMGMLESRLLNSLNLSIVSSNFLLFTLSLAYSKVSGIRKFAPETSPPQIMLP